MPIRINIPALFKINPDYQQVGLFSNVQAFGSGWKVVVDHGDFLLIEGRTADGRLREANISADCVIR